MKSAGEKIIRIKLTAKFTDFNHEKVRTGCQTCTMLKFVKLRIKEFIRRIAMEIFMKNAQGS